MTSILFGCEGKQVNSRSDKNSCPTTYLELSAFKKCRHLLEEPDAQLPAVLPERTPIREDDLLLLACLLLRSQVAPARAGNKRPAGREQFICRTLDLCVGHTVEDDTQRCACWAYDVFHGGGERVAREAPVEDVRGTERGEQLGVLEGGSGDDGREARDAGELDRWGGFCLDNGKV